MNALKVAVLTLASIILFYIIFAPSPEPMTRKNIELFVTESPAWCQAELRTALNTRRSETISLSKAQGLRSRVCEPPYEY